MRSSTLSLSEQLRDAEARSHSAQVQLEHAQEEVESSKHAMQQLQEKHKEKGAIHHLHAAGLARLAKTSQVGCDPVTGSCIVHAHVTSLHFPWRSLD